MLSAHAQHALTLVQKACSRAQADNMSAIRNQNQQLLNHFLEGLGSASRSPAMKSRLLNKIVRGCLPVLKRSLFASSSALAIVAISALVANGQSPVRDYRHAHERQILDEFTRLLGIPNVASDRENIHRNAQFIIEMMQRRGLNPRLLETSSKETPPAVYGEWKIPGATRSVVFYAHYDGQPTDPKQWTGTMPWQPVWRTAALES